MSGKAAARAGEAACQAEHSKHSVAIEKWARRKREAPNKDAVERERDLQWAEVTKQEFTEATKQEPPVGRGDEAGI